MAAKTQRPKDPAEAVAAKGLSTLHAFRYTLLHCVRLHSGANDAAYRCVFQEEDAEGRVGVHLSKDLMAVAGRALKANIVSLGHVALPKSEQLRFLVNLIGRKVRMAAVLPSIS